MTTTLSPFFGEDKDSSLFCFSC